MSTRAVGYLVDRLCEQAGIEAKKISPHSCRHSYAIRALRGGANVVALQKLMGHANAATTCSRSPSTSCSAAGRPGKKRDLTPPERLDLEDVMRVAILKNRKGKDGRTVDLRFRPVSRRLYEPAEVTY